jgi:NAD(P)-dependent dehydrogenase (short-subunit alcohol dehydrogenase family)
MKEVVLITGGGRRVGAGLVEQLAAQGYRIALHYHRSVEGALELQTRLTQAGHEVEVFAADLNDDAERAGLIPAVAARLGKVDVLINSASLFKYDDLASLTPEGWQAHLMSNLTAPVFLIKALAEAGGKLAINMLDQKVFNPNPDFLSYTAGKVGLAGLIKPLAMACAPGMRVCGLAPGVVLPSGDQSQADFEAAVKATPLGLSCTIEDLARAIVFMIETPSFTGQIMTVDGGESLTRRPRDVAFDVKG